jgi:hypothetical protein
VADVKVQVLRILVFAKVGDDPAGAMALLDVARDLAHHIEQAVINRRSWLGAAAR